MRNLAKKRLSENFKQSVKYLTLVFNDFFILAIIFLFGALMFWYAQTMKTIPDHLWFYRPLVALVLWLPLTTGHLVTLLKKADMQFLFPKDDQMKQYLAPMLRYSLSVPFILEILLAGIVFPFATVKAGINVYSYLILIIFILLEKTWMLEVEESNLYFRKKVPLWLLNIVALVIIELALVSIQIWLLILFAIMDFSFFNPSRVKGDQRMFDWRYAVEVEKARKDRVYSIFSMFTDVSEKEVAIKRRKYLDFLLPKKLDKENPNLFLYRRSLLRNPEYLNLLVRMTAFAILISWLVQDWKWALGLSCLVIFLTVYQLLPMANEFDSNIMYRVYPIVRAKRSKDLIKVLNQGLVIQWLLISIFWLIVLPYQASLWLAIAVLFIFTMIVNYGYLPVKANKKIRR